MTTSSTSNAYGLAQSVLFCLFAAAVFFVRGPLLFVSEVAPIAGNVLSAAGLVFMLLAIAALRKVIQVAPEPRAGGHLVTAGAYRWFRHPIYTGIVVVIIGMVLRRPTLAAVIAAVVVIVFLVIKTRYEESLLIQAYPDYAEYKKRTWGIIPGIT